MSQIPPVRPIVREAEFGYRPEVVLDGLALRLRR
jgi:hypothetical protein